MNTHEETKTVVDAYYQAGVEGRLPDFGAFLDDEFVVTAPNYLPGAARISEPTTSAIRSWSTSQRLSTSRASATRALLQRGGHAAALINIGVVGTEDTIQISEHWEVRNGKATSIWVAYFEPQPLPETAKDHGPRRLGVADTRKHREEVTFRDGGKRRTRQVETK